MPRAEPKRQIKVFIASPSDLAVERRAFRDAIDLLNLGFGDGAGVEFIPLGWEDTLAVVRSRSQAAINQDIDACDIFVLVMHRRWGQPAPDAAPYSSYTEEEFYRALNRWRGAPLTPPTPAMKASQPGYAGSGEIAGSVRPAASDSTATPTPSGGTGSGAMPLPPAPSPSLSSTPLRGLPGNTDVPVAEPSSGAAPLASSPSSSPTSPSSGDTSTSQPPRAPDIFVFFKHIDPASMADAGPQLAQVLKFRRQLEDQRIVLYRNFADEKEFAKELDRHLRAYVHGDLPKADAPLEKLPLPLDLLRQVEEERAAAQRRVEEADAAAKKALDATGAAEQRAKAETARSDELSLRVAERAAKAALDGRIEEARQDFALVTPNTANIRVLYLAYEFYQRVGDWSFAESVLQRWLAISAPNSEEQAGAYGNLGLLYQHRGKFDQAEDMHNKSLAIFEAIGSLVGMAKQYGNLGILNGRRDDLDRAEEMLLRSLAISVQLQHRRDMATQFGNLGIVYARRREPERAEAMYQSALAIDQELGNLEGVARHYGTIGLLHRNRGELDAAKVMLEKALAIDEKQGRVVGMAINYCNLGVISKQQGNLDHAEAMHNKAIAIEERLGRLDGVAHNYVQLAAVAEVRHDLTRARDLLIQARDLYSRGGVSHTPMIEQVQEWLDKFDRLSPSTAEPNPERLT